MLEIISLVGILVLENISKNNEWSFHIITIFYNS